jgi:membrane protein
MGYVCKDREARAHRRGVRWTRSSVADPALVEPPLSLDSKPAGSPTPPPPRRRRRIAPWYWAGVVLRVSGRSAKNFAEDRGTQMAAAISYYTLFSLLPLLILTVAIFGLVLRDQSLEERVINTLIDALPLQQGDVADVVRGTSDRATELALISLVGVIWTSGALSASLRTALNVAFEARRGRPAVRGKLIDYALLPILGLPVLGSVVLSAAWRILRQRTEDVPLVGGEFAWVWDAATISTTVFLSFLAFSLLYWLAPNRTVRFRYIWPGALFAALAFEGLKLGFSVYLENFANYEFVYGALGSVVVLLFWVFLSANILILGAEIANEVPHVLHEEPRHGRYRDEDRSWISAVWKVIRWLILAPEDEEDHLPPGTIRPQPEDLEELENGSHIDRTRHRRRADRRADEQLQDRADQASG